MKQNSGEKSSTISTIVYWIIYLPILALAVVSLPFNYQKKQEEQSHLENSKQRVQSEIEAMKKEIDNLNVRLQYYKGEKIKQHAERLGLHKPEPGQFIVLDQNGAPVYAENRTRPAVHNLTVASQDKKRLIYTTPAENTTISKLQ